MSISRDDARELLTDKQFEAWDYSERGMGVRRIAAAIQISPSAVKDRLFAARQIIEKHQQEAA